MVQFVGNNFGHLHFLLTDRLLQARLYLLQRVLYCLEKL